MPPKKQKRGRGTDKSNPSPKKSKKEDTINDEELLSQSEDELDSNEVGEAEESENSELEETADEKRARLAKEYLQKIQDQLGDSEGSGDEEDEEDRVQGRLDSEVAELRGRRFVEVAESVEEVDEDGIRNYKGHRLPATCVAVTDDEVHAFTGSKDGSIVHWDVETGKRITWYGARKGEKKEEALGHTDEVLALAVSTDGRYVASGGRDTIVRVWDVRSNKQVEAFTGHRSAVGSVAFRLNSHQLFTGSDDRTIKIWNLDEMAYVETLFGHQSEVNGLDSLYRERAVSCGSDRTVRQWKVVEESQLIYRGHLSSIDCVRMINEDYCITGGGDGSIGLFNANKKKPVLMVKNAHLCDLTTQSNGIVDSDDEREEQACWISSVACLRSSDLLASGSSNGYVKLWKWTPDAKGKSLAHVQDVPVNGFINGLAFAKSGRFLAAATAQEHRLGRWWRIKDAKNGLAIIPLSGIDMSVQ